MTHTYPISNEVLGFTLWRTHILYQSLVSPTCPISNESLVSQCNTHCDTHTDPKANETLVSQCDTLSSYIKWDFVFTLWHTQILKQTSLWFHTLTHAAPASISNETLFSYCDTLRSYSKEILVSHCDTHKSLGKRAFGFTLWHTQPLLVYQMRLWFHTVTHSATASISNETLISHCDTLSHC